MCYSMSQNRAAPLPSPTFKLENAYLFQIKRGIHQTKLLLSPLVLHPIAKSQEIKAPECLQSIVKPNHPQLFQQKVGLDETEHTRDHNHGLI